MVKCKVYRNIKTKEIIFEDDAKDFALDSIGVKITPKGKNGELTIEQLDMINMLVDWYYDADWIMEQYEEEDEEAEERAYRQELEDQKELEREYNNQRI